jgi:hypothetical protein
LADLIIEDLHDSVDENTHKTSYFTNNSEIEFDTAWSSAQCSLCAKKTGSLKGEVHKIKNQALGQVKKWS